MTTMVLLLRTEIRRALDTRASAWLLSIVALLSTVALVLTEQVRPSLEAFVTAPGAPLAALLPVVTVITACSDRGHRAHLVTYALVPRRSRILAARAAAVVIVVVLTALAASVLSGVVFVVVHPDQLATTDWRAVLAGAQSIAAVAVSSAAAGLAVSSLISSSAIGVVVVLLGPLGIEILLTLLFPSASSWVSTLAVPAWLAEPNLAWETVDGVPGLGAVIVSTVIWFVVPFTIGAWRQVREDVH